MKITMVNGNVAEGTVAELRAAGLLATNTQVSKAAKIVKPTKKANVIAIPGHVSLYQDGSFRQQVESAILKARNTRRKVKLPVVNISESNVRSVIAIVSNDLGINVVANKVKAGNATALMLTV